MDRRRFLTSPRSARTAAAFEVLPGVWVDGGPVRWDYRTARPAPVTARSAAPREPLDTPARLGPYLPSPDAPWTDRRARHLLRRTGLAARPEAIEAVRSLGPGAAVDALVDGVLALPPDTPPAWIDDVVPRETASEAVKDAYWEENWERYNQTRTGYIMASLGEPALPPIEDAVRAFHQRLRVMWHNHFVTHQESYALAPWAVRYWQMLGRNALGDVRTFVREAGLDPAMLVYLNGVDNRVWAPNENYARELLELFTMGISAPDGSPNYTQADIAEISRALTGYGLDIYGDTANPLEAVFIPDWHDAEDKTIFGRTGPWGYDDVVDLIFQERAPQVAHRIAGMIYQELVYEVPHPDVVAEMADQLWSGGWQLAPVVRTVLQSEHFFSDAALSARVRSPYEHHVGAFRDLGFVPDAEFSSAILYTMWLCGQSLWEPPTVAGWPGGRDWLDTSRLTSRWLYDSWLVWQQPRYRALADTMPDPWDAARLAADLAEALLGAPLSDADAESLTPILLNGIPPYEWNPLLEGAESRLRGLVAHLLRLPEFQLA